MENEEEIRKSILSTLYLDNFTAEGEKNLEEMRIKLGVEPTKFNNLVDKMSYEGLIKAWTAGYNYIIQANGILIAEEESIPPDDIVAKNRRIRTVALDRLANVFAVHGGFADLDVMKIAEEMGISEREVFDNLQLLEDIGYVEHVAASLFKITFKGLDAVQEWQKKVSLSEMLEEITGLPHQVRGIKFQTLMREVLVRDGWQSEESVKTEHEEMDIIFSKGREYYLVECKWQKGSIEARIVRELFGKVSNRVGVHGVLFSWSGFTSGAIQQGRDYASQKIIIFFGPKDIEALIKEGKIFDDMLNSKYKAYVTRTQVEFS